VAAAQVAVRLLQETYHVDPWKLLVVSIVRTMHTLVWVQEEGENIIRR
jgi:hypothetical protein